MNELNFSVIIAVYERVQELTELLSSLEKQTDKDFEVLVIDDGSAIPIKEVVEKFSTQLNIRYFYKRNSGPALSRNFGMEKASGNYFIFLDSDTIVPAHYIETVRKQLTEAYTDSFGGPDAADESFSELQKAISFSMTSFLTTGGIRGGGQQLGKFQPRSFNMGMSRNSFQKTKGFGNLRIGEDPDLSMTLWENGFETQLIKEALVFHKRRTTLRKFVKQVYRFGIARPILNQRHPKYNKILFWFPSFFLLGLVASIILLLMFFLNQWSISVLIPAFFYLTYFFLILIFSTIEYRKIKIGLLSILTSFVQILSYGYGFLKSWFYLNVLKIKAEKAFPSHFSKG